MELPNDRFKGMSATNVVLLGFKGCGKTRVGKALAQRLGWDFIDLDALLEEIYLQEQGEPLSFREIYRRHGEGTFRELEGRALEEALQKGPQVLALGGGTPLSHPFLLPLLKQQILVYLSVEPEVLFDRILQGGLPAFFDPADPRTSFETLSRQRIPVYRDLAHHTFDNTHRGVEEVADEIARGLGLD